MTLVAHDYLQRFNSGSYARGFGPLDDMLVAMMLSTENGLKAMVADPVIAGASAAIAAINQIYNGSGIKQAGESDFDLLKRIAATYDADFWVDGETLYLSRLVKEYTPRATLTYGENLLDFAPHVSLVGQIAGVSARFTLREIPLDFYVTVGWDFDKETLSFTAVPGDATPSKDSSSATFTIVDKPIRSPADIKNSALLLYRELRNKVNNRLTGHGSSIGNPRIRAGAVLRLEGLGPDFSGDYRVASATHSIDGSGYRTNFEVRKEIIP
jgi:phage protein D